MSNVESVKNQNNIGHLDNNQQNRNLSTAKKSKKANPLVIDFTDVQSLKEKFYQQQDESINKDESNSKISNYNKMRKQSNIFALRPRNYSNVRQYQSQMDKYERKTYTNNYDLQAQLRAINKGAGFKTNLHQSQNNPCFLNTELGKTPKHNLPVRGMGRLKNEQALDYKEEVRSHRSNQENNDQSHMLLSRDINVSVEDDQDTSMNTSSNSTESDESLQPFEQNKKNYLEDASQNLQVPIKKQKFRKQSRMNSNILDSTNKSMNMNTKFLPKENPESVTDTTKPRRMQVVKKATDADIRSQVSGDGSSHHSQGSLTQQYLQQALGKHQRSPATLFNNYTANISLKEMVRKQIQDSNKGVLNSQNLIKNKLESINQSKVQKQHLLQAQAQQNGIELSQQQFQIKQESQVVMNVNDFQIAQQQQTEQQSEVFDKEREFNRTQKLFGFNTNQDNYFQPRLLENKGKEIEVDLSAQQQFMQMASPLMDGVKYWYKNQNSSYTVQSPSGQPQVKQVSMIQNLSQINNLQNQQSAQKNQENSLIVVNLNNQNPFHHHQHTSSAQNNSLYGVPMRNLNQSSIHKNSLHSINMTGNGLLQTHSRINYDYNNFSNVQIDSQNNDPLGPKKFGIVLDNSQYQSKLSNRASKAKPQNFETQKVDRKQYIKKVDQKIQQYQSRLMPIKLHFNANQQPSKQQNLTKHVTPNVPQTNISLTKPLVNKNLDEDSLSDNALWNSNHSANKSKRSCNQTASSYDDSNISSGVEESIHYATACKLKPDRAAEEVRTDIEKAKENQHANSSSAKVKKIYVKELENGCTGGINGFYIDVQTPEKNIKPRLGQQTEQIDTKDRKFMTRDQEEIQELIDIADQIHKNSINALNNTKQKQQKDQDTVYKVVDYNDDDQDIRSLSIFQNLNQELADQQETDSPQKSQKHPSQNYQTRKSERVTQPSKSHNYKYIAQQQQQLIQNQGQSPLNKQRLSFKVGQQKLQKTGTQQFRAVTNNLLVSHQIQAQQKYACQFPKQHLHVKKQSNLTAPSKAHYKQQIVNPLPGGSSTNNQFQQKALMWNKTQQKHKMKDIFYDSEEQHQLSKLSFNKKANATKK